MIISGAMTAQIISSVLRNATLVDESSGAGRLGCTDTHEHAKIVARQLQTMSQTERCSGHGQGDEFKGAGASRKLRLKSLKVGGRAAAYVE